MSRKSYQIQEKQMMFTRLIVNLRMVTLDSIFLRKAIHFKRITRWATWSKMIINLNLARIPHRNWLEGILWISRMTSISRKPEKAFWTTRTQSTLPINSSIFHIATYLDLDMEAQSNIRYNLSIRHQLIRFHSKKCRNRRVKLNKIWINWVIWMFNFKIRYPLSLVTFLICSSNK